MKSWINGILIVIAALKLGGVEARGESASYTTADILVTTALLLLAIGVQVFMKPSHPKADYVSQNWLNQDFAEQSSAVRSQHRR